MSSSDAWPRYQGPSPDEVALVEGARQLGFEFRGRTRTHITIAFLGHQVNAPPDSSGSSSGRSRWPLSLALYYQGLRTSTPWPAGMSSAGIAHATDFNTSLCDHMIC